MHVTQVSRHVEAPRAVVYRALVDADALARWRVPTGMSSRVHVFDAREGGAFRGGAYGREVSVSTVWPRWETGRTSVP